MSARRTPSPNEQKLLDALHERIREYPGEAGAGWDLDTITHIAACKGFVRHRSTIRDHVHRLEVKGWLVRRLPRGRERSRSYFTVAGYQRGQWL